ncbi:MAG: LCP family protein [Bacilli bacterium]|nr:LCP family protein [Bacilli bacterium]
MSKRVRKKSKLAAFLIFVFSVCMIGGSGYLISKVLLLKNIENTIRLVGSISLCVICLVLLLLSLRFRNKYKTGALIFTLLLMLVIGSGSMFAGYNINKVYDTLASVSDTSGYKTYSSSLVTLNSNSVSSIDGIKDETLGILSDKESIEGYEIPKEVIKKKNLDNDVKEYSTFIEMIDALYKGEINYIFLPTNYSVMFGNMDGYQDIKDKTKIIFTEKKKKKEKDSLSSTGKKVTEPFSILIMGVDSEEEEIRGSSFNGDSLMLVTFNPKTLSSTILSIPRDSYVPIACFSGNRKNKITHAAWKGEDCMIDTIHNFLDVDIDYYVKINFKGVVKLVDTLGGVEVDVPYNLCEQNSSRQWGKNTVYIEEGHQVLNGEQALAYSRNRHPNPEMCSSKWTNYNSSDFVRGLHQQEVVTALLNKFKDIKDLDTVYKLLDTISVSMVTNMSTDQILSLYNVFKDAASRSDGGSMDDILGIQRLQLNGYDTRIVDYGGTNLSLYNYVLYDESVKEVSDAMKENLGIKKSKTIKSFSFDVNNPYEKEVIGAKTTGKESVVLVPNFVGQLVSNAQSWGSKNGVSIVVNGGNGYVLSQNVPAGANVEDVKSITVNSGGSKTKTNDTKTDTEDTSCKTNEVYSKTYKKCVCMTGYEKNTSGKCVKEDDDSNINTGDDNKKTDTPIDNNSDEDDKDEE